MLEVIGFLTLTVVGAVLLFVVFIRAKAAKLRRQLNEKREKLARRGLTDGLESHLEYAFSRCLSINVEKYIDWLAEGREGVDYRSEETEPTYCVLLALMVVRLHSQYPVLSLHALLGSAVLWRSHVYLLRDFNNVSTEASAASLVAFERKLKNALSLSSELLQRKDISTKVDEILEYLDLDSGMDEKEIDKIMLKAQFQLTCPL